MSNATFDERLSRITTRHRRMAAGVSYRIGPDGLMVPVPRRVGAARAPIRTLLVVALMAYACKLVLYLGMGEGVYVSRLDLLREQGAAGEIAVRIMEPDSVMRTADALLAGADLAWLRLP